MKKKKYIVILFAILIIAMLGKNTLAADENELQEINNTVENTIVEDQNVVENTAGNTIENTVQENTTQENIEQPKEEPKEQIKLNIKDIKLGVYQLKNKNGKVITVSNNSQDNSGNIVVSENKQSQNQKIHISRVTGTKYFKLSFVHSAKLMTASGGKKEKDTNVIQYKSKGLDTEQWFFSDCGNGYYYIVLKNSKLCLDISGNNIQLNELKNVDSQKFKLISINIINNKKYEIESSLGANKVVTIKNASKKKNAIAEINSAKLNNNQRFYFTALTTDTYKIIASHSKLALTVDKKKKTVYQAKYTGARTQKWQIIEVGERQYRLVSKANGLSLGVSGGTIKNGQKMKVYNVKNKDYQKFKLVSGLRTFYKEGTYGKSGLLVKGDKERGTKLKYYKFGHGSKVLFATFSIHGFEDSYDHDGKELTYIAEEFKKYLTKNITKKIINKYTIYIFPCLNPDGQNYGTTNNGEGRTTLYSKAPNHQGIDMNRGWPVDYEEFEEERNYNGTKPLQAYEAKYLRDFILKHQGKQNILVDTHGWLEETMGDKKLGSYYRKQFKLDKHIPVYGRGYLINWATTLRRGRSVLVELPEVKNHKQVVSRKYAKKWIKATMNMLNAN